jgi:hypothetical protein
MASSSESGRFYCFAVIPDARERDPESSAVLSGMPLDSRRPSSLSLLPQAGEENILLPSPREWRGVEGEDRGNDVECWNEKKPRLEGRGLDSVRADQPSRIGT